MRWALVGVVCVLVVGCGQAGPAVEGARVVGARVAGEPAEALVPDHHAAQPPLVVWFHSKDSDERVIAQSARRQFFEGLVRRGIVVTSSRAGGNAWGNSESVRAYRALITWATARWHPRRILLVGESMGGVPSLEVARRPPPHVVGWVGISPVVNLRWAARQPVFAPEIKAATHGHLPHVPRRAPVPMMVFASDADRLVPTPANAARLHARLVHCRGDHLDPSCRQPGVIARFLASV